MSKAAVFVAENAGRDVTTMDHASFGKYEFGNQYPEVDGDCLTGRLLECDGEYGVQVYDLWQSTDGTRYLAAQVDDSPQPNDDWDVLLADCYVAKALKS